MSVLIIARAGSGLGRRRAAQLPPTARPDAKPQQQTHLPRVLRPHRPTPHCVGRVRGRRRLHARMDGANVRPHAHPRRHRQQCCQRGATRALPEPARSPGGRRELATGCRGLPRADGAQHEPAPAPALATYTAAAPYSRRCSSPRPGAPAWPPLLLPRPTSTSGGLCVGQLAKKWQFFISPAEKAALAGACWCWLPCLRPRDARCRSPGGCRQPQCPRRHPPTRAPAGDHRRRMRTARHAAAALAAMPRSPAQA